jgi:pimeloyl-ACP methyl ester carboxylesterase
MESKFIKYQNKNIHYKVSGKGKPVVFLHGFGEDGNIWNELIKDFENDYHLIVPDIPGSGLSEILDGENISIDDYADAVKAILDTAKIKKCSIIGHSMGGYITLAFAEKYPELLDRFGLFHSSAFADDDSKKQTRLKAIDFIKANGAYAFLKASIPNLFADKKYNKEIEEIIEKGRKFTPEALIQYYEAMINRPDRTAVLKKFDKPILFIIGEKDNAIPLQSSLQQCYLPSISHVNILEAGHMGMIEQAETCKIILRSFINT